MTTTLPIGGFQAQQTFAFNHDILSTMSMRPVTVTKTPYRLEILEPLPYSQKIYDTIAFEERAQDVKSQFESMNFQPPIRRIGNLRYSGLVNRLPKSFNFNTTERGTSTNPISTSDKNIETFPSKLQRAISSGYLKEVKEESFESPSLSMIKEMTEKQLKSTENSKERLRDQQMKLAVQTPVKKGKQDNNISSSSSGSPVSPLQGKGKGPLIVDPPKDKITLTLTESSEGTLFSIGENVKTNPRKSGETKNDVLKRLDAKMKSNRRNK